MPDRLNRHQQAVVYLRVAHGDEISERVVDAQREACRRIAGRHGLSIVREYADLGRPARLEEQAELRNLLSTLAVHRDAAYVVVWDYTRLSRNLRMLDDILDRIRDCGAQVVTLRGVEAAERFIQYLGLLDEPLSPEEKPPPVLYPIGLLRATFQGLAERERLVVTALLPNGETVSGAVIGIGSRLGVQTADGQLLEDIRPEWIVHCTTQRTSN
jgi:Resolvase, N terminal domain